MFVAVCVAIFGVAKLRLRGACGRMFCGWCPCFRSLLNYVFDLFVVMRLLGDCVCESSSVFILLGESSCLWFLVRFLCLGLLLLLCLMGLPFLSVWGMIFGLLLFLLVLGGGVGFEMEVVLDAVLLFCLGLS